LIEVSLIEVSLIEVESDELRGAKDTGIGKAGMCRILVEAAIMEIGRNRSQAPDSIFLSAGPTGSRNRQNLKRTESAAESINAQLRGADFLANDPSLTA